MRNPLDEAAALNNVEYIYLSLGRYDEAQTYLQQAVTIRERLNVPADVADTLHNLAEVSVRTGAIRNGTGAVPESPRALAQGRQPACCRTSS